jgi:hypothetical protein
MEVTLNKCKGITKGVRALPHNAMECETVAELPGLSSSCTMKECKGVLPAFGLRFTPHIQCQTRTDLLLRPHAVDTPVHLTIASVAPLG